MTEDPSILTADRRARELRELPDGKPVDVVVIGGGITGAGIALDAASRGLKVVLVERDDLASGTSSRSSRVVHGGTRYLADGSVGLAHESAAERATLMQRVAPHLVRPLPMLLPELTESSRRTRTLARLGFHLGDLVRRTTGLRSDTLPRPRRVSAGEAQGLIPALNPDAISGAMLSFDAQLEDDARLVVAVARTAAEYGATILTRVKAETISAGEVECTDLLTGDRFTIETKMAVNATGGWAGELEPALRMTARKGVHLLVPAESLGDPRTALAVPIADKPAEVVFAIPQSDGLVLVGATDSAAESFDDDSVSSEEITILLGTINRALQTALKADDVIGSWAGTRPVLEEAKDGDLERRPAIVHDDLGNLTIVGGKLTTYRKMAEDAVDRLVAASMTWAGECQTADLPLIGAGSPQRLAAIEADERLVRRYGVEAPDVLALAEGRPELLERVVPELPVLRAEMVWGIERELAMTAEDLVDRRTRIGQTKYREAALTVAQRLLDIAKRRPTTRPDTATTANWPAVDRPAAQQVPAQSASSAQPVPDTPES